MANDNFSESSIKIGNNNDFRNGNVVGNNNHVIISNQNNSSVSYEGERQNVYLLNKISQLLIQKYGKRNLNILSILSLISSMITIWLWLNSFSDTKVISFLPQITAIKPEWLAFIALVLMVPYIFLPKIFSYHSKTKCKNCKKEFAYDECKNPLVEEIETSKGIIRSTIRYYKCNFCGDIQQIKVKEVISKDKNI